MLRGLQVELDEDELQLLVAAGGSAGDKMFTYTPLELGDASDVLPSYLKVGDRTCLRLPACP